MRLKFLSESMRRTSLPGAVCLGVGVEKAVGQEQRIGGDQNTEPGVRSM